MKKKFKEGKLRLEKFTVAELNQAQAIQIKGGTDHNGGGHDTVKKTIIIIIQGPPPHSSNC